MKTKVLHFALSETTHAMRFTKSAARRFETKLDELEAGAEIAASLAFIKNKLSDARDSLFAAEGEIGLLIFRQGSQH
jgi:hypothetical protein